MNKPSNQITSKAIDGAEPQTLPDESIENALDIDLARRTTLKIAAASAGVAAVALSPSAHALSAALHAGIEDGDSAPGLHNNDLHLAEFTVQVQHAWAANDLEIVITNTGDQPSSITAMTPAVLKVARGSFDFSALLANGPIMLEPGDSVAVPLTHSGLNLQATAGMGHFDSSLQKQLRATLSIVTEDTALASVTIPASPRIV